ncbi:MAG: phage recombination protein Bet, partial [Oscillospiraceae bacterium]
MAQNSLVQKSDKMVEYDCNGEKVKLSPAIIKNYLVSGSGNVSDQEVVMFLNLCRFQHLNPFLREAYLIKFGSSPATMVTGKEVFTKRAKRNKDYKGFEAGVIVVCEDGSLENRTGTFKLSTDTLVGGWAKVYIDNFSAPVEITVSLDEYIGLKAGGEVNSQWSKKPATMIRKVALVQALREAFPEDFQGMYSPEETAGIDMELDTK